MDDDGFERRMEELRSLGLSDQEILNLVDSEVQRALANSKAAGESLSSEAEDETGEPREPKNEIRRVDPPSPIDRVHDEKAGLKGSIEHGGEIGRSRDNPDVARLAAMLMNRRPSSMQFSGPLPPPNLSEQYERLLPGFLDRQVRLQERKADIADKELQIVEQVVTSQFRIMARGQWFAAALAFGVLILAAFIGDSNAWAGAGIAAIDIAAISGAFMANRRKKSSAKKALPAVAKGDDSESEKTLDSAEPSQSQVGPSHKDGT